MDLRLARTFEGGHCVCNYSAAVGSVYSFGGVDLC